MRVVHVCTTSSWGAGRAAYRLHQGLLAAGLDSRLFVQRATRGAVDEIELRQPQTRKERLKYFLRRAQIAARRRLATRVRPRSPFFSDDWGQSSHLFDQQVPLADVYNLHWVAGFVDYRGCLPRLASRAPVVWTLHDMNPFTGGCHYDYDCGRFAARCGVCPQLGSLRENDLSRRVWNRKKATFVAIPRHRLAVVTPSCWLADEARRSSLLGRFGTRVIPYGLDTSVFRPFDRGTARVALGLPDNANVVVFVASGLQDSRKGLAVLLAALDRLRSWREVWLLSAGEEAAMVPPGLPFAHVGNVTSDHLLALIYSAGNALVVPSLQDNLPNTLLEALSCGAPVVGSAVGGIPDALRHGETGLLVPPGDSAALAEALRELFTDPHLQGRMAEACRRLALAEYTAERQATRYIRLYHELVGTQ